MDHSNKEGFEQRLLFMLKKILEFKNVDNSCIEKYLSTIDDELKGKKSINTLPIQEWLLETVGKWKNTPISLQEIEFMCKFIGLLFKYNEKFQILQNTNVLNDFVGLLQNDLLKHTTIKIIFIKLLCAVLDHNLGYDWISTSQVWKMVVDIYCSNVNLYIEREGIKFFEKLISTANAKENINDDILSHVFLLIQENCQNNINNKDFSSNILMFLKLLEIILKFNMFSENNSFRSKIQSYNLEAFLKNTIENSEQEIILEAALRSQVLLCILHFEDIKVLLPTAEVPAILDLFSHLVKQNKFNCIIKLAKYCQIVWNKLRIQMCWENAIGLNFILIQLLPSLIYIKIPNTYERYDLLIKKLFSQKPPKAQELINTLGKAIKGSSSRLENLVFKGILSLISNVDSFNHEEAVLTLQAMLLIAESLISDSGYDLDTTGRRLKILGSREIKNKSLLSAILNGFALLLEKFKINWTDLEELGLFKISLCVLKIPDLCSSVVVQTLLVIKAAVVNSILRNTVLSIHCVLESIISVICELMTNSSWEIRDSCIEVVIAIAELSQARYPAFEQILLDKNIHFLLLNLLENDAESYVRASAIRALILMTRSKILNPFSNDVDSCSMIIKLVQSESEGIVRREAALLIKEIYLTLSEENCELINLLYRVMGGAALSDLYWEVKINSLAFWETVIQRIFAEISKSDQIGLEKGLRKLSKIGCLHVLLTIVKEDCDMIVIEKSVEVLCDLLNILNNYNITKTLKCRKRKNLGLEYEKHKTSTTDADVEQISVSPWSEKVTEEIVNDSDINLLTNVSCYVEGDDAGYKSVVLKEVEPETFLLQMQDFDKDLFLENKQKSFTNIETDLTLTMNKINIEESSEINVLDCY